MKTCGLIAEYNPFHKGHAYQIEQTIKQTGCNHLVVVMSGDFVQRGEPAIINKYKRAEIAVKCGADLVVELPSILASSSAEHFAFGAVNILNRAGIIDCIIFGSESGNLDKLNEIANITYDESNEYKDTLKSFLKDGLGFPSARSKTLENLYGIDSSLLNKSNNILAIEYLKSLKQLKSKITPITIKRIGDDYNDKKINSVASATAIRESIKNKNFKKIKYHVPKTAYETLLSEKNNMIFFDDIYKYVRYEIIRSSPDKLLKYQDVTEGIENTLKKNIHFTTNFDELFDFISTKRFTKSKIKRAILNIYLSHTKDLLSLAKTTEPYIKVLAMNKKGTKILKQMKHHDEDIKIVVNNKKGFYKLSPLQKKLFLDDVNSSLLYNHLITEKAGVIIDNDYQKIIKPI